MLALSPLGSSTHGEEIRESDDQNILLEDISFDDLFEGFEDGDILPDLEIDPADIFADFSFSSGEESGNTTAVGGGEVDKVNNYSREEEDEIIRVPKDLSREGEVVSARTKEEDGVGKLDKSSSSHESGKGRKSSGHNSKGSQGKKKAKVDWTPELHRRFVQAVEQLGVDKAVPSRILELMGIDCLTRHNIASHLQKYRSHRKHLLAREAEAASWSHRRQMYSNRHAHAGGGVGAKMNMNPNWVGPPIMGFPPPIQHPTLRPLHVWGHPTAVDHQQPQLVPMWPRPPWPPHRPPHAPMPDPSYWHHPLYQRPLIQGTPCFPQLMPTTFQRYPAPPVPGIPPHPMYRAPQQPPPPPPPHNTPTLLPSRSTGSSHTQLGAAQPTSENIDAAIGDVLAKPWSPLPLGLKPPSLESVMVELQKQGVPQVPPTCSG